jgi:hypothetical protein
MAKGNGNIDGHAANGGSLNKELPQLTGVLDQFNPKLVTPMLGTEFPNAAVAEWLRAPNSADLIRDLAITSKTT